MVAAQFAIFTLAVAILLPAITPGRAVSGGPWVKLLFLLRMAALVALAHWMLVRRSLGWSDAGLSRPNWRRFALAIALGFLLIILLTQAARMLRVRLGLPDPDYSMFAPVRAHFASYLFWLLPVSLGTAAFGEELIFRGFIAESLQRLWGGGSGAIAFAIVAQAALFGGAHFYQGAGGMIDAGAIGLALGLIWLIAGRNLWAGIVVHALLDGSAMTAIYLGYAATS